MNLIDWIIIGIAGISVLFGLYRGFLYTLLHSGVTIISAFIAFKVAPLVASLIDRSTSLHQILGENSIISRFLPGAESAMTTVQDLTSRGADAVRNWVQTTTLPAPIQALLESDLISQMTNGQVNVETVTEYIQTKLYTVCANIIGFIIAFLVCLLVLTIVIRLLQAVFKLPLLKKMDHLAGGALGLARGVLVVYVLMAAVPLLQTVLQMPEIDALVRNSTLGSMFSSG